MITVKIGLRLNKIHERKTQLDCSLGLGLGLEFMFKFRIRLGLGLCLEKVYKRNTQ